MSPPAAPGHLRSLPPGSDLHTTLGAVLGACEGRQAEAAGLLRAALAEQRPAEGRIFRAFQLLLGAGMTPAATQLAEALAGAFPGRPMGHAARARLAEQRKDWAGAVAAWDRALALDPEGGRAIWRVARATSLARRGSVADAEREFRDLLSRNPDLAPAAEGLLQALLRGENRWPRILEACEHGPLRDAVSGRVALMHVQSLSLCHRVAEARDLLPRVLDRCASVAEFEHAFLLVPRLFDPPERGEVWRLLRSRLPVEATPAQADALAMLRVRLRLACGETADFLEEGTALLARGHAGPLARYLASALRGLRGEGSGRPKILGIGLSKTGTTSLCAALDQLGFTAVHWTNPLTNVLLEPEDVPLFDAFTDESVTEIFEAFHARAPDARFILTRRPPAAWEDSFARHYARSHGTGDFLALRRIMANPAPILYGERWRRMQQQLYYRHASMAAAREAHERRVRNHVRDRQLPLLELDIFSGQGWPELCGFLGCPVPDAAFPRENAAPDQAG